MASILGVETLQHTNGTDAATIKSDGTFYPTGGVVQVVQTVKSDYFTTTSEDSFVDIPSLSATITPKSTSSKIMVDVHIGGYNTSVATNIAFKIVRDSTDIGLGATGQGMQGTFGATPNADRGHPASMKYLDSPATTSATTYKIQVQKDSAGTLDVNRRPNYYSTISTITLTEIAG